jgi:CRP/FNR family transcriptional regulator, cyclic AMP receptor protein
MVVQVGNETLRSVRFLNGLNDAELSSVANICGKRSFAAGDLCQVEGVVSNQISLIISGRVGTVIRLPNVIHCSSEIILDTQREGDAFGWSSLIKGTPMSTLKALEPTEILYMDSNDLLELCQSNDHLGYIVMKNLASLIASKLRRNRMSMLNAIVAFRGEL